jgi:hypothetical protein
MTNAEPPMLDVGQFESLDDAMNRAEPGSYADLAEASLPKPPFDFTYLHLFFMSMVTRTQGLHDAIAREIRHENPHAVFPLMRALAEAVVLMIYVIDHPEYVRVLTVRASELDKRGPKRKSLQRLINYAQSHAPGMKRVYAELSEITHFGSIALWSAHSLDPTRERGISWSSAPRWHDEHMALVACAQVIELAGAMEGFLREFAARYLAL